MIRVYLALCCLLFALAVIAGAGLAVGAVIGAGWLASQLLHG